MMIELGVAAWCLDIPGPNALLRAAECGLRVVQIDAGEPNSQYYIGNQKIMEAYRRISNISKVSIVGIGAKFSNDIGMTSNEKSKANYHCRMLISDTINAAVQLGTKFVFFPSFRKSEIRDIQGLFNTAKLLKQACIWAAPYGIEIGSENSLDWKTNLNLMEIVREPNFRILIDSYNPLVFGHSVSCMLKNLMPYMAKQIHVKDGIRNQIGNVPLGAGEGCLFETIKTLKSIKFEGIIVLENKYLADSKSLIYRDLNTLTISLKS